MQSLLEQAHTQKLSEQRQRLSLGQNSALRLQMKRHYFTSDKAVSQLELSWHWYL